jgi:hypothetical protein
MTAHLVGISQAAEFHALAPGSVRLPLPPRFTFGTFPADIAAHYYDAMNLPADGVYAGAGFVVSDFFVMDREARLLYGGEINLHPFRFNDMTAARQAAIAAAARARGAGAGPPPRAPAPARAGRGRPAFPTGKRQADVRPLDGGRVAAARLAGTGGT